MKKYRFVIWFGYFLLLMFGFGLHDYFVQHNLLNDTHILVVEFVFLFLGWFGARLEIKLKKHKR